MVSCLCEYSLITCQNIAQNDRRHTDICALSSGGRGHVENALVLLRGQGHDGQERGGSLKHIMSSQVLGCSSDWNRRVEDLESDLAPLANRVQVDSTVDQCLGELTTTGLQSVGTNSDGSGHLVGLKEFDRLRDGENVKELLHEVFVVAIVQAKILEQLRDVVVARSVLKERKEWLLERDLSEIHLRQWQLLQNFEHRRWVYLLPSRISLKLLRTRTIS